MLSSERDRVNLKTFVFCAFAFSFHFAFLIEVRARDPVEMQRGVLPANVVGQLFRSGRIG